MSLRPDYCLRPGNWQFIETDEIKNQAGTLEDRLRAIGKLLPAQSIGAIRAERSGGIWVDVKDKNMSIAEPKAHVRGLPTPPREALLMGRSRTKSKNKGERSHG